MADGAGRTPNQLVLWLRALRVRQWIKNLLVVAVPLASGALLDGPVLVATTLAFVAFCLASSAVYLGNDVHDQQEDRAHPTKRHRPIAAGDLAPAPAVTVAVVLAATSIATSMVASAALTAIIGIYLLLSLTYTWGLKHQPVLDIAIVAAGFVLRALAGGAAAGIPASQWFLMAAGFGSLFLVAGKRFSEKLLVGGEDHASRPSLAGYTLAYLRFVWTLAATITVATYALWAFEMQTTMSAPALAQISIVPFVLAVLRYAMEIETGRAGAPEDVALGTPVLQGLGLAWLLLFVLGVWNG